MRREKRKHEKNNTKTMIIVSGSIVLIVAIVFAIGVMFFSNKIDSDIEEGKLSTSKISDLVPNANQTERTTTEASSNMGKTVNELTNSSLNTIKKNETTKTNQNVSNKTETSKNTNVTKQNETKTTTTEQVKEPEKATAPEKTEETKQEEVKEPVFIKPVEGEIIREFAKDKLVYSETLGEWITHNGIDIKADKTTVVKASAEGKVSSIKNDPRYGLSIVITHNNGFQTVYANLLTAEFVTEGETVESGQTLGTVGTTSSFEALDDSHLHFEMTKDGEYVDPNIYIK